VSPETHNFLGPEKRKRVASAGKTCAARGKTGKPACKPACRATANPRAAQRQTRVPRNGCFPQTRVPRELGSRWGRSKQDWSVKKRRDTLVTCLLMRFLVSTTAESARMVTRLLES